MIGIRLEQEEEVVEEVEEQVEHQRNPDEIGVEEETPRFGGQKRGCGISNFRRT